MKTEKLTTIITAKNKANSQQTNQRCKFGTVSQGLCVSVMRHWPLFLTVWSEPGMPQRTWLGPCIFLIHINDLQTPQMRFKFIDDITIIGIQEQSANSHMQTAVDSLVKRSTDNYIKKHLQNKGNADKLSNRTNFLNRTHLHAVSVDNKQHLTLIVFQTAWHYNHKQLALGIPHSADIQ